MGENKNELFAQDKSLRSSLTSEERRLKATLLGQLCGCTVGDGDFENTVNCDRALIYDEFCASALYWKAYAKYQTKTPGWRDEMKFVIDADLSGFWGKRAKKVL